MAFLCGIYLSVKLATTPSLERGGLQEMVMPAGSFARSISVSITSIFLLMCRINKTLMVKVTPLFPSGVVITGDC